MNPHTHPSHTFAWPRFGRWSQFLIATAAPLFFLVGPLASDANAQASESFSNLPTTSSSSYLSRSWTGDDAVTWTAEGARTDQTINGKAICFGTSGNRWVTSPVYTQGIGTLSFNYVRAFTGTNSRSLEVYVNGNKIGDTITVSPTSDVVVAYSEAINIPGSVQLQIRSTGTAQVKLDDIAWTAGGSDLIPPAITTLTPANNEVDVLTTTNQLVATFDENVSKGTGNITLKLVSNDSAAMTIDVTDAAVAVTGATATITLPASLSANTAYYVNIDAGAFKDAANNSFAGISDNSTWVFTTAAPDLTPPAPALFPVDDSTDFVATASPTLTYDEPVALGVGIIELRASSGGALIESFDVATSPRVTLSGATLRINPAQPLALATGYYLVVPQGVVQDLVGNPSEAITGPGGWNFTTRGIPAVVISQYYEGTSTNRYLELHNTTGAPVSLDEGYQIASFSPNVDAGNQGWKTGQSSPRVTNLSGVTIPANGYFLIAEPAATLPFYAIPDLRPAFPSAVAFSGTASIVLYKNTGFAIEDVIDAISVTTNQGEDISFYRQNNLPGFDFDPATNILAYTGASQPWATKTIAEVNAAGITDPWLLRGTVELGGALTLEISPATLLESAGPATATLSRSGNLSEELIVIISNSNPNAAFPVTPDSSPDPAEFVSIPQNQSSVVFNIHTVDTPWLTGNRSTTITVTAAFYTSDSKQVTVQDDPDDQMFPVVINEVDCDTPGTDQAEFIELYNNSNQEVSLDGVALVLYNGGSSPYSGEASYLTRDLSGHTIPAKGFFVIGNPGVTQASVTFTNNALQNGPDAVALYLGAATLYPDGTLASSAPGMLVDAVVYGTSDPDATALLAALTPGQPQVDEGTGTESGTAPLNSIARVPDGGAPFQSSLYVAQTPTPGASNVLSDDDFAAWIGGFEVGLLTGFNDDFDNDGLANALENILGSDPSAANQGISLVSASGGNLVFRHTLNATPASDLQASYEWSADLATWQASGASAGGTTVTFGAPNPIQAGPPALVEVSATVSGTPPGKVFARLKVVQN
jgi:hypothetical protein